MPKQAASAGKERKKAVRIKPDPHPFEQLVGKLIRYYDGGWRHGYLEEVIYGLTEAKDVLVRPIAGYKATKPRCVQLSLTNIQPLEIERK